MKARPLFRGLFLAVFSLSAGVAACGWSPSRPFEREAPQVREAIAQLVGGGDAQAARSQLEEYLATGACKEGNIGTPSRVREMSNGAFDLGLALFQVAETYGSRFGDEANDAGSANVLGVTSGAGGDSNAQKTLRGEQVDCALKVVRAIASDGSQPVDLRARARYLEGNLLFLTAAYEEAVRAYDSALAFAPGMFDGGPITITTTTTASASDAGPAYEPDAIGRDAAWNRAIALRRIEDQKDAGSDAAPPDGGSGDSGQSGDQKNDPKNDQDSGAGTSPDAGGKNEKKPDGGPSQADAGAPKPEKNDEKPDPSPPAPAPSSRQNQDERMLDQLENAPTVQQEAARKQAQKRGQTTRGRGMSDK